MARTAPRLVCFLVSSLSSLFNHLISHFLAIRSPASLDKHLEAYNEGALAGDMEYAVTSLLQYSSLALCGCGDNLETLEIRT